MAIKFDKIVAGMELLDIHSEQAGNTTMRRVGCWPVLIVSVDQVQRTAVVRWNVVNEPETWGRRQLERLYAKVPPRYKNHPEFKHVEDPDNTEAIAAAKAGR